MSGYATIHDHFLAAAARASDRTAMAQGSDTLLYAELDRTSDRLARRLQEGGIEPGARVGIYAQRSMESIVAMLGILKAGAAYVPFDPSYPVNLLRFIYRDCAPEVLLVQRELAARCAQARFWDGESLDIRDCMQGADSTVVPVRVSSDAPAYIMYTSGSTGHPKGVVVPHRAVVRLCIDNPFAAMGPSEVHLQLAPLAFDASTFEIWGALLNGGTLAVLAAPYPTLDDIAEAIARHRVTTLWLTAGLFHLMVEHRLEGLKPLRQLIAGGDVLSPAHVARALRALPDCQLINGYGPTENTTFTCTYSLPHAWSETESVPIGTAIAHTQVYVLDGAGAVVADGQEGELYAAGAGVALGYLNRPELTAERFLVNPFGGSELMYRTGDRVRRRADGIIEFLGRIDRQIKINGKRVELDEIESCMRRCPIVEDAAVASRVPLEGPRKVHAYVKSSGEPGAVRRELREFLKQELPEHMLPASITVLDALPLTPTGKVDRARLPEPKDGESPGAAMRRGQPESAVARLLVKVWSEVLGRETIGVDDNFFDLGGTSLQLIEVHATLRDVMQRDISVVDLFQYPRISALAAHFATAGQPEPDLGSGGAERGRRQREALTRLRPRPSRTTS